jgi:hypothetical protein
MSGATQTALKRVIHEAESFFIPRLPEEFFCLLEELALHIDADEKEFDKLKKKKKQLRAELEEERCVSGNIYDSAVAYVRHKKMKKYRSKEEEEDIIKRRVEPTLEQWDIVNPNTL